MILFQGWGVSTEPTADHLIRNGLATLAMFGQTRVGCT